MTYTFEPYDTLQIKSRRDGEWLDFGTLRTQEDGDAAVGLVDAKRWGGEPAEFRIVRKFPFAIKYAATAKPQIGDLVQVPDSRQGRVTALLGAGAKVLLAVKLDNGTVTSRRHTETFTDDELVVVQPAGN